MISASRWCTGLWVAKVRHDAQQTGLLLELLAAFYGGREHTPTELFLARTAWVLKVTQEPRTVPNKPYAFSSFHTLFPLPAVLWPPRKSQRPTVKPRKQILETRETGFYLASLRAWMKLEFWNTWKPLRRRESRGELLQHEANSTTERSLRDSALSGEGTPLVRSLSEGRGRLKAGVRYSNFLKGCWGTGVCLTWLGASMGPSKLWLTKENRSLAVPPSENLHYHRWTPEGSGEHLKTTSKTLKWQMHDPRELAAFQNGFCRSLASLAKLKGECFPCTKTTCTDWERWLFFKYIKCSKKPQKIDR